MTDPLIRPAQVSQLRAAAAVMRELYDDGYIDCLRGLDEMADDVEGLLLTYSNCQKDDR